MCRLESFASPFEGAVFIWPVVPSKSATLSVKTPTMKGGVQSKNRN